jgi:hypothetical protein
VCQSRVLKPFVVTGLHLGLTATRTKRLVLIWAVNCHCPAQAATGTRRPEEIRMRKGTGRVALCPL